MAPKLQLLIRLEELFDEADRHKSGKGFDRRIERIDGLRQDGDFADRRIARRQIARLEILDPSDLEGQPFERGRNDARQEIDD